MLNKNEYLLDEILKTVDHIAEDKSDDAVMDCLTELVKEKIEHGETLDELQGGIAYIKIELVELKTMLQQIVDFVSKPTIDIVKNVDNSQINRTRNPIGAYGDTTDEI